MHDAPGQNVNILFKKNNDLNKFTRKIVHSDWLLTAKVNLGEHIHQSRKLNWQWQKWQQIQYICHFQVKSRYVTDFVTSLVSLKSCKGFVFNLRCETFYIVRGLLDLQHYHALASSAYGVVATSFLLPTFYTVYNTICLLTSLANDMDVQKNWMICVGKFYWIKRTELYVILYKSQP